MAPAAGDQARAPADPDWVTVGEVNGLFGVDGSLRLYSHFENPPDLLGFERLWLVLEGRPVPHWVLETRRSGRALVARLEGVEDRDQARRMLGTRILVPRALLGEPEPGEYLWADLIGLRVRDRSGAYLGEVVSLMETGANDVLVVRDGDRERLIPFLSETVLEVDLEGGVIRADWDPDF